MIGVVLTGHGRFAEGMESSLQMIAGKSEALIAVNFLESEGTEELSKHLNEAVDTLMQSCQGVLIACDLLGGSPFKEAATLSVTRPNIGVVAGINLASCLELLFARMASEDASALADNLIALDANRLLKFELPQRKESAEVEDGI